MMRLLPLTMVGTATLIGVLIGAYMGSDAHAATERNQFTRWERETGRQVLEPAGASVALSIPPGTTHAEFRVFSGTPCVRWDGNTAVDSGSATTWGCTKWFTGEIRKEENDGPKLALFRVTCADCVIWMDYFAERRASDQ